jgi:hypothetical protein
MSENGPDMGGRHCGTADPDRAQSLQVGADRLGCLLVVVTGVVLAALRVWALHGCPDCVAPV